VHSVFLLVWLISIFRRVRCGRDKDAQDDWRNTGATTESFCLQKVYGGVHFTLVFRQAGATKLPCRERSKAGLNGAEEDAHTPERKAPGGELRFRSEEQRQVYRRCGERAGASRLQVLTSDIRP